MITCIHSSNIRSKMFGGETNEIIAHCLLQRSNHEKASDADEEDGNRRNASGETVRISQFNKAQFNICQKCKKIHLLIPKSKYINLTHAYAGEHED
jgi:hypothetical protein